MGACDVSAGASGCARDDVSSDLSTGRVALRKRSPNFGRAATGMLGFGKSVTGGRSSKRRGVLSRFTSGAIRSSDASVSSVYAGMGGATGRGGMGGSGGCRCAF